MDIFLSCNLKTKCIYCMIPFVGCYEKSNLNSLDRTQIGGFPGPGVGPDRSQGAPESFVG